MSKITTRIFKVVCFSSLTFWFGMMFSEPSPVAYFLLLISLLGALTFWNFFIDKKTKNKYEPFQVNAWFVISFCILCLITWFINAGKIESDILQGLTFEIDKNASISNTSFLLTNGGKEPIGELKIVAIMKHAIICTDRFTNSGGGVIFSSDETIQPNGDLKRFFFKNIIQTPTCPDSCLDVLFTVSYSIQKFIKINGTKAFRYSGKFDDGVFRWEKENLLEKKGACD